MWRKLKAAYFFLRMCPAIEIAPDWTETNQKGLSKFMSGTETGKKYVQTMQKHIQIAAYDTLTSNPQNAPTKCAYGAGLKAWGAIHDSLLYREEVKPDEPEDEFLARLTPELRRLIPD